jgi:hypothetical protein
MKRLLTIGIIGIAACFLLSACSRAHISEYHGAAYNMNFDSQVINPEAPTDDELKEGVSGPVGESIYRRHSDTYKEAIPKTDLTDKKD